MKKGKERERNHQHFDWRPLAEPFDTNYNPSAHFMAIYSACTHTSTRPAKNTRPAKRDGTYPSR
jgi:hypothetical protein